MIVGLLVLLTISLGLFAQGQMDKSDVEVKVLAGVTGGKDEAENKLFEEEMEKATGLNISWEKVPSGYDQVLMQKLGAGEEYDLIYLNQFQMYTLAKQGALTDLTDRIKGSSVYAENVDKAELEKIALNGKYYAGFAGYPGRVLSHAQRGEDLHGDQGRTEALLPILHLYAGHLGSPAMVQLGWSETWCFRR
jgi:putative aldouronate transport system substrate-binding protein